MNEVARAIGEARSRLTQGLGTLQSPGVPRDIAEASGPIAHAVGLLHQLDPSSEASLRAACPALLSTVQRALHQLQWSDLSHPALAQATDHVATALGYVFGVARELNAPQRAAVPVSYQQAPVEDWQAPPLRSQSAPVGPAPIQTSLAPPTLPQSGAQAAPSTGPDVHVPVIAASNSAGVSAPPTAKQPEAARHVPQNFRPLSTGARRAMESLGSASTDSVGLIRVDVALAANSASNFYRGFGGEDVFEHGGIFVATYNLPEVGSSLVLRVVMPGGHEFQAQGVVRWRRLAPAGGSHAPDVPPGFGLAFEDVPKGARELVDRYVKNREPLFHDHDDE